MFGPRHVVIPTLVAFAFFATPPAAFASAHTGDSLAIKVYNHPELSRTTKVDGNGNISLPVAGTVSVVGLDERAIAGAIAAKLAPYVIKPAVSVETVAQGDNLFISGGPGGVLKYEPGETLASALADALQITAQDPAATTRADSLAPTKIDGAAAVQRSRIDLRRVGLIRDGKTLGTYNAAEFSATGQSGPALAPGDTIVLTYKPIRVRVLGDVTQPGNAYLAEDEPMSDAIAQSGGLLATAVSNRVILERDGTSELVALGDSRFTEPAKPGDVLTIPEAPRVTVTGMVYNPGTVTLKTDFTLLSAMFTAGGPTKWANLKDVEVIRNGEHQRYDVAEITHGDLSQNPTLKDGDTVLVSEGHKIDFTNIYGFLGIVSNVVPRP